MTQQEMEREIKDLKDRLATWSELSTQLAALRKTVRQIEVNFYKDIGDEKETED